jgi:hypothetical protein
MFVFLAARFFQQTRWCRVRSLGTGVLGASAVVSRAARSKFFEFYSNDV